MREFTYVWSLSATWQRWRSHHSIRHSSKTPFHDSKRSPTSESWKVHFCRIRGCPFPPTAAPNLNVPPLLFFHFDFWVKGSKVPDVLHCCFTITSVWHACKALILMSLSMLIGLLPLYSGPHLFHNMPLGLFSRLRGSYVGRKLLPSLVTRGTTTLNIWLRWLHSRASTATRPFDRELYYAAAMPSAVGLGVSELGTRNQIPSHQNGFLLVHVTVSDWVGEVREYRLRVDFGDRKK